MAQRNLTSDLETIAGFLGGFFGTALAEVGDIRRCKSHRQLAAYAGMVPAWIPAPAR